MESMTYDIQRVRDPEGNKIQPAPLSSFWLNCMIGNTVLINQQLLNMNLGLLPLTLESWLAIKE